MAKSSSSMTGGLLLEAVTRLTNLYEHPRPQSWAVSDAPDQFIKAQLKGIVGIRMPITRLEGKRKLSQNRTAEDREGVVKGLMDSDSVTDQVIAN